MLAPTLLQFFQSIRSEEEPASIESKLCPLLCEHFQASSVLLWRRENTDFVICQQCVSNPELPPELVLTENQHTQLLFDATAKIGVVAKSIGDETKSNSFLLSQIQWDSRQCVIEVLFAEAIHESDLQQKSLELELFLSLLMQRFPSAKTTANVAGPVPLDSFAALVHQDLDSISTCENIANELRRVLDLDRVSVCTKQRGAWRLGGISGQAVVNPKSKSVRNLENLVVALASTKRIFWLEDIQYPPAIHVPLERYLKDCEVRSLVAIPVLADRPNNPPGSHTSRSKAERVIGMIVIESFGSNLDRSEFELRAAPLLSHASLALQKAHQYEQIPFHRFWRYLGEMSLVERIRQSPIRSLLLGLALVLLPLMFFIPMDFYVSGTGTLVPIERMRVYVEQDGVVESLRVKHGDKVTSAQSLMLLRNEDLELQMKQVSGEISSLKEKLAATKAMRISNVPKTDSSNEERNTKGMQKQLESLEQLQQTLDKKNERLKITSPIAGQVVTWNLDERLLNRPVQAGEVLVEIANSEGEWEMFISIPSRNAGYILDMVQSTPNPRVVYALSTEPSRWFDGTLEEIEKASRLEANHTQTLMLKTKLSSPPHELLSNNSAVAKVYCGKRSVAFVWLHEAWYYIEENFVFPYWPF